MNSVSHFFQNIRHAFLRKRLSHHHWWAIIVAFIALNSVFGFVYVMWWIGNRALPELLQEWNYIQLAEQQNIWGKIGMIKLWALEQWRWYILSTPNTKIDESILPIKKAFFLESKWDLIGAEQLLSLESHDQPTIRALYLVLRAYFYCIQNKFEECAVLAQDSVLLDPLAPIWLQLQWVALVNQRKFTEANDAFTRAEKLGGKCTSSWCLYHRWLVSFYTTQYDSAQSDLLLITGDQQYWNNALLFLWRTYYNQQQWSWATDFFNQVVTNKSWSDWNAELWLARVDNAQWNTEQALQRTTKTFASWGYGIELLTDMIQYAHFVWNQSQVDFLLQEMQAKVWNSLFAHLIVTRTLMIIGYLDRAEQYLQQWLELIQQWEEDSQTELLRADLEKEWFRLILFQFYKALQNNEPTETMLTKLQQWYAKETQQIAFVQLLQQMIQQKSVAVWTWIQTIASLQSDDERHYVLIWRDLLNDQPIQALERLVRELPWWEDTPRHIWIKRAITKRLWQDVLSRSYQQQLQEIGAVDEYDTENDQRLWKKAFAAFDPWLLWMYPYLSPDRFWKEEWQF